MKLNKRNCEVRIRLTPCHCDFLRVHFRIGGDNHYFHPSGVMGDQFAAFLFAAYCLYEEEQWPHLFYFRGVKEYRRERPDGEEGDVVTTTEVAWDEEGRFSKIKFTRRYKSAFPALKGVFDPVLVDIDAFYGRFHYEIDGRDLCYAIARGCTETLKRYGFQGYKKSTGGQYYGDEINVNALIFIKAYALDALEVRDTERAWAYSEGWAWPEKSSFDKEIELLLFDM